MKLKPNKTINPTDELIDELEEQTSDEFLPEDSQMIEDLQARAQEFEEKYKRVLADYQNLEHRMQVDRIQNVKMANKWLIESLLEPIDFMEKATVHINDAGLKMVIDRFYQVLEEYGLKEIPVMGKMFDEKTMEAVDTAEGEENKVVKVVSKGFMLHDQVLRHAKVVVGQGA
jgi:molecular chaperone GrpE